MTARIAAGCLCLVGASARPVAAVAGPRRPPQGPAPRGCTDRLAVVLAVRYLAQACAIAWGHGGGIRLRVGIEALHALTMALAAATLPRHRSDALAALCMAAAVALADVADVAEPSAAHSTAQWRAAATLTPVARRTPSRERRSAS